jgi:hypothetical protein
MSVRKPKTTRKKRRIKYPYVQIDASHAAPMVPIELWTGTRWLWVEAYVDSGASTSIFHYEVYDLIKPALTKVGRVRMSLGDGRTIVVQIYKTKVRFAGKTFHVEIGFSRKMLARFNLVGRSGFFDRFRICFDEGAKVLNVTGVR